MSYWDPMDPNQSGWFNPDYSGAAIQQAQNTATANNSALEEYFRAQNEKQTNDAMRMLLALAGYTSSSGDGGAGSWQAGANAARAAQEAAARMGLLGQEQGWASQLAGLAGEDIGAKTTLANQLYDILVGDVGTKAGVLDKSLALQTEDVNRKAALDWWREQQELTGRGAGQSEEARRMLGGAGSQQFGIAQTPGEINAAAQNAIAQLQNTNYGQHADLYTQLLNAGAQHTYDLGDLYRQGLQVSVGDAQKQAELGFQILQAQLDQQAANEAVAHYGG